MNIDIVILWVNDEDKSWREKRNYWAKQHGISNLEEARYRNWDNFHYVLRGIEKYASWVNKIYLVTDLQKPKWLNENNKKIVVVDHKEIIDNEFLPTFNSSAIELNIHKIKGLSENFIYINDDMFFIDYVEPEDFFIDNIPVDVGIQLPLVPEYGEKIYQNIFNNMSIINDSFNKKDIIKQSPLNWFNIKYGKYNLYNLMLTIFPKFSAFTNPHTSVAYNKKTFTEVWSKYEKELLKTVSNKFRKNSDYTQWLFRYWQLASNNFKPQKYNFSKNMTVKNIKETKECAQEILKSKYKVICINDNEKLTDFYEVKEIINETLLEKFPEKSEFEK